MPSNPVATESVLTGSFNEFKISTPKRTNVDFEEALEETGFGKYNYRLILTCGLLLFASNCETSSMGFVLPPAECDLYLDNYTKGILTSITTLGITASSIIWGLLSDIKGRRKLMMLNLVLSFATGVVASLMPSFWGIVVLRLLNGICIACPAALSFVYLGEFLCTKTRDKCTTLAVTAIALCLIYLPSSGWLLLQKPFKLQFLGISFANWRIFMLTNSLPSLVATLALWRLPETPKYLYYSGKPTEALQILRQMYSINTGQPEESYPVVSLDQKVYQDIYNSSERSGFKKIYDQIVPLFKPPLLVYTLAACAIQTGITGISSGLLFWYPDIVNQVVKSGKESVTICEALSGGFGNTEAVHCNEVVEDRVFILNIIIGVYYIFGYASWGLLVKKLGTRNVFILCSGVPTLTTVLLCFISQRILIDVFFISSLTISGIGFALMNAWVVEIFPTNVGGMALCIVMTFGRLGSVAASSVTGILLQWNCLATFGLYAFDLIACLALSFLLPQKSQKK